MPIAKGVWIAAVALSFASSHSCFADIWGRIAMFQCVPGSESSPGDQSPTGHFFVRIFRASLGGNEFAHNDLETTGIGSFHKPVSCTVAGRVFLFEPVGFRSSCADCDLAGFKLSVNGNVVWEVAPTPRSQSWKGNQFVGTIDADAKTIQICREHSPESIGVELPYEPNWDKSRTSVLICEMHSIRD